YIVVLENVTVSRMQSQPVDNTSMAFRIIYDHVVPAADGIDRTHYSLITVVTTHHSRAHRGRQPKTGRCFRVYFPDIGVVGQAKIIVETPNNFLFSPEKHPATDLSFQFGECKITVCSLPMLTDRAVVLD